MCKIFPFPVTAAIVYKCILIATVVGSYLPYHSVSTQFHTSLKAGWTPQEFMDV